MIKNPIFAPRSNQRADNLWIDGNGSSFSMVWIEYEDAKGRGFRQSRILQSTTKTTPWITLCISWLMNIQWDNAQWICPENHKTNMKNSQYLHLEQVNSRSINARQQQTLTFWDTHVFHEEWLPKLELGNMWFSKWPRWILSSSKHRSNLQINTSCQYKLLKDVNR